MSYDEQRSCLKNESLEVKDDQFRTINENDIKVVIEGSSFTNTEDYEDIMHEILTPNLAGTSDVHVPSKKNVAKMNRFKRQRGEAYVSTTGKFHEEKTFSFVDCKCRLRCGERLCESSREDIFNQFWNLGDWNAQTAFIIQNVVLSSVKRKTVKNRPTKRNVTRNFFLNNILVCKVTFLRTLSISNKRLDYAVRVKVRAGTDEGSGDLKKSLAGPESLKEAKDFLDSFPKYRYPFDTSEKVYFHSDLTIAGLYEVYSKQVVDITRKVSYELFSRVFRSLNIPFYIPKQDKCFSCDYLKTERKCAPSLDKVLNISEEIEHHNSQVEMAKENIKAICKKAKGDESILVFSFAFHNAQFLPHMNGTNVMFCKRQLLFNILSINTFHDSQGFMCVWTETQGNRGMSELCSCILEFLQRRDLSMVKKIYTFSEFYPGRSRMKALLTLIMYVCQKENIAEWEHTFTLFGHSYLQNENDFAVIDKRKKSKGNIYDCSDWINVIQSAKRNHPFQVIEMNGKMKNFISLSKQWILPEYNCAGNVFNILDFHWFKYEREHSLLRYKSSNHLCEQPHTAELKVRNEFNFIFDLENAYPNGVCISHTKYNNLLHLLHLIPVNYHQFFLLCPYSPSVKRERYEEIYPEGIESDCE